MLHPKSFCKIRNQSDPFKQPVYDNILLRKMKTLYPDTTYHRAVAEIMGGNYGGGGVGSIRLAKFSVEVGNFEGGIETAMKKRVAVEKERVSILNEQTKCSRSICIIFLNLYALTFISKTRRK